MTPDEEKEKKRLFAIWTQLVPMWVLGAGVILLIVGHYFFGWW
jgi:hypothetical protein